MDNGVGPSARVQKLELVWSPFKNCPMVISHAYPPPSRKVSKDRNHQPSPCALRTQPVTALHPAGKVDAHEFLPPIALLSLQVQRWGPLGSPSIRLLSLV